MIDDFYNDNRLVVVDPVLGDNGRMYGPISSEMVSEMNLLIGRADIITPNLTEASLLLGRPFPETINETEAKDWMLRLSDMGPGIVVITSVLTGALLQGDSLPLALDRAVHFITYGVRATLGYSYDQNQGILLERILSRLNFPMPVSSYEIL